MSKPDGDSFLAASGQLLVAGGGQDGGVFVAGSLAWGIVKDGFRPDRYAVIGCLVRLVGVAVTMYAPRNA